MRDGIGILESRGGRRIEPDKEGQATCRKNCNRAKLTKVYAPSDATADSSCNQVLESKRHWITGTWDEVGACRWQANGSGALERAWLMACWQGDGVA